MGTDVHGNAVTGASAQAIDLYTQATREFACYVGDPLATLAKATEDNPGFAMAHLASGHIHLSGMDSPGCSRRRRRARRPRSPRRTTESPMRRGRR